MGKNVCCSNSVLHLDEFRIENYLWIFLYSSASDESTHIQCILQKLYDLSVSLIMLNRFTKSWRRKLVPESWSMLKCWRLSEFCILLLFLCFRRARTELKRGKWVFDFIPKEFRLLKNQHTQAHWNE